MRQLIIILISGQLWGGIIVKNFEYSRSDLAFTDYGRYTLVELKGSDQIAKLGEPILPGPIYHFVIPPDAEVASVELIEEEIEDLPGFYILYPGQRPRPLTQHFYDKSAGQVPRTKFQEPKAEVYNSDKFYPEKTLEFSQSGSKGGFRVLSITLYPLRYLPKDGRLRLSKKLTVKINYQEGSHPVKTITERQFQVQRKAVRALVTNKKDVDQFRPIIRPNSINDVNYAIVTGQEFVDDFKPLADWKTKKGWMAKVFSTDWIYSNYPGYDNPEKIRNFFKDYYQNKGLIWAILGGDIQIVPTRYCYSSYSGDSIPCDWYYCDLDSNWNRNGNAYYGEIGDVIPPECYFEIYAGRDPIDSTTHIQNFIRKLDIFEKSPDDSGVITILLPSTQLFSGYHGRIVNNAIAKMFPPWWRIIKREDPLSSVVDAINTYSPQFLHFATHGGIHGFYSSYGSPILVDSQIPYLTNKLPGILNSIASYTGSFDSVDCFAEYWLNWTGATDHSAGIAAILNARYGFGTPPSMGPSEQFDTLFYHMVCYTDTLWLGVAFAASKEHFRNAIWSTGLWHYCGLEQNLMGEPEMGMYLDIPIPLSASYKDTIEVKPQSFIVKVSDDVGLVANALVCCYKENEVHETGWTNSSGQVTIDISPQTPGTMFVTASCFNHLPYEDSCTVITAGVETQPDRQISQITVAPTIIKEKISIPYSFSRPEKIDIKLFDPLGRKIIDLYSGRLEGEGVIRKKLRLPYGVYFVRIEHKAKVKTYVVVVGG